MDSEPIAYERVADRPPGWRKPPEGIPRQCWNIWSLKEKKCLTKEEAYSSEEMALNPDLSPYYCKYHTESLGWPVYHRGHRKTSPGKMLERNEDLLVLELGIRATIHLLAEDSPTVIRRRCQTAAEKRGEYGRIE